MTGQFCSLLNWKDLLFTKKNGIETRTIHKQACIKLYILKPELDLLLLDPKLSFIKIFYDMFSCKWR